jgi:hypothetical protein
MNGKNIVVIGALAAGAYLLLRSGGIGGGAEGGGTKKATAITGIVPGFDGGTPGSGGNTGGIPSYPETPSAPFQPSQYLMDLINQKFNTQSSVSKKEISASGTLGNVRFSGIDVAPNQTVGLTDYGKSLSGLGIHTQAAYTTASSNPNEKMVFLGPFTNVAGGGIHAVAAVTTKKSSSSSPSRSNYNPGAGNVGNSSSGYRYSGSIGGWGV